MHAHSRLRVLLALLLAVALLGACGGDDDEPVADDATTTTAGDEEAAPEDGEGEDGTTTSAPTSETTTGDEGDEGDDTTDETFTGDADSEWCATYQELQDLPDPFGGESTPEEAAGMFQEAFALADELVEVAPPDILEATERAAAALREFDEILSAYDYDFERLGQEATPEELEQLNDPELQEASEDLEAYASQVCGIE